MTELIKEGSKSLASMTGAGAAAPTGGAGAFCAGEQVPVEKEKQYEQEAGDVDVCDLFGGDDDY